MGFKLNHIHLKSPDPEKTARFYADYLGAKIIGQRRTGFRLDLHGLPVNVSRFQEARTHQQVYGIEHIALDTDDFSTMVAKLKDNGVRILEETTTGGGRRACFFEGPEGVCLEVVETVKS